MTPHTWDWIFDGGSVFLYEDLPWNWKVMLENFNDGYHANRLRVGIGDHVPSENARFLEWDDDQNQCSRLNCFTHIDGGFKVQLQREVASS